MFGIVLLAVCPPPAPALSPPELADLGQFPVCREVARINRDATAAHTRAVVWQLPHAEVRWAWECRQDHVHAAWAAMVGALDESAPAAERVKNLGALRSRIGTDAYYAGRLPSPVPAYGAWHPSKD